MVASKARALQERLRRLAAVPLRRQDDQGAELVGPERIVRHRAAVELSRVPKPPDLAQKSDVDVAHDTEAWAHHTEAWAHRFRAKEIRFAHGPGPFNP